MKESLYSCVFLGLSLSLSLGRFSPRPSPLASSARLTATGLSQAPFPPSQRSKMAVVKWSDLADTINPGRDATLSRQRDGARTNRTGVRDDESPTGCTDAAHHGGYDRRDTTTTTMLPEPSSSGGPCDREQEHGRYARSRRLPTATYSNGETSRAIRAARNR